MKPFFDEVKEAENLSASMVAQTIERITLEYYSSHEGELIIENRRDDQGFGNIRLAGVLFPSQT